MSNNGSANGTQPTEPKSSSSGQTRWGRFYELAGVLLFIATIVFFMLGWYRHWAYWLAVPVLLAGAMALYKRAAREVIEKVNGEKKEQAKLTYKVTKVRLITLRSVGVPLDLRTALTGLLTIAPEPADEFLKMLARDVSWERINRWREVILTHTRIDNPAVAVPVVNQKSQPSATVSVN